MSLRRVGALVALVVLLSGCTEGVGTGGELQATHWVLDSYLDNGTLTIGPDAFYADAEFATARVSGFSGCNQYNALYVANGRRLSVSSPSTSLMACDEATMGIEQRFITLLAGARTFSVRGNTLTVFDDSRQTSLVFDAAPRNPLLGRWEVGGFQSKPGTVASPLPNTSLEVTFGIASVGGSSGCNTFSGTYGTNGEVVRISPLATTQMACDTDVMDQEAAFLTALQSATRIDVRGSQVNLADRSGAMLVALLRPAEASPSPSAEATATAKPTATPTKAPTASPSPSPTPAPTPTPTSAPTASPAPTISLPPLPSVPSLPPTGSCQLLTADGTAVAAITYPGTWSTVTEPPSAACRYFDPKPITVPADPATLKTAVMAGTAATAYSDAVAAATDPSAWTVAGKSETTVDQVPVTCVLATAAAETAGIPVGTTRYACLADVGKAGTVQLWAAGAQADPTFMENSAVVGLMTAASTFTAPQ